MISTNSKEWTQDQYEAFIMMVAAATDLNMDLSEKRPIMEKVGEDWNELLNIFRGMNDSERIECILQGKDEHIKSEADRDRILAEVKTVFEADEVVTDIEIGVNSLLKRLL